MRILHTDDDPDTREGVKLNLEDAGHEVVSFPYADQALDYLKSNSVDLIITDYDFGMGYLMGDRFARMVKEAGIATPIILLSNTYTDDWEEEMYAPFSQIVHKSKGGLRSILRNLGAGVVYGHFLTCPSKTTETE